MLNGLGTCRSIIEARVFDELDNDPHIACYMPEPFKIPYSLNGVNRNYIPDILVNHSDGRKILYEVKVNYDVTGEKNLAKWDAAEIYARQNQMQFLIWVRITKNDFKDPRFSGKYTWREAISKYDSKKHNINRHKANPDLFKAIILYAGIGLIFLFIALNSK